jgi:hypothetical protein
MTKHSLIIEHPTEVFTVPNPSVKRLKCSWHLGMMMRIIETPLLKRQANSKLVAKRVAREVRTNVPRSRILATKEPVACNKKTA